MLDALAIAGDVARALVQAHAAGVIHRDVKPGNVFLCSGGQIEVLDFGLAQLYDPIGEMTGHASPVSATRAGTPRYMAPELFHGHVADACTDVYALGVTLLETLVEPPPPGDHDPVELRIARTPLSARLRRLLRTATASTRASRFQDAGELLTAVNRARDELAKPRHVRRRLGLALAAVAAAALASVAYRCAGRAGRPAPRAVAVVGFDDLSGTGERAWLSTALSEMLNTDLAASPGVHVVPQEQVGRARTDLKLPERDLSARALQGLRRHLGVAYTLTGSYLSVATGSGTKTGVAVRLEGAEGELVDAITETSEDAELLDAMARIASRVRVRLAGTAITADEARGSRTTSADWRWSGRSATVTRSHGCCSTSPTSI